MLWAFAAGAPAEARQDDPRLDALFEQLLASDDRETARRIEGTIWRIWTESGSATIDELMTLGVAAMGNGQFDTALESFDAIIEAAPDFAEGWNKRATVYYLIEEYPASVRDVEATLRLEPRHFGALSGMGLIYTALEDGRTRARMVRARVRGQSQYADDRETHRAAARKAQGRGDLALFAVDDGYQSYIY